MTRPLDDALVRAMYEAAAGMRPWPAVLDLLSKATDAFACQFAFVDTVRSQLKAIFTKTGTHRQAELVQVLLRAGSM